VIVVSDTGPLNYLLLIDRIEFLPEFYELVAIPSAVIEELTRKASPQVVRVWVSNLPEWTRVFPSEIPLQPARDEGEGAAIVLAKQLNAPLLCDDKPARARAEREGLVVSGTLGVLIEAHARGMDEISRALDDLSRTNYHMSKSLVEQTIEIARERKLHHQTSE
jgi:predicted nucleic acid-binding protein